LTGALVAAEPETRAAPERPDAVERPRAGGRSQVDQEVTIAAERPVGPDVEALLREARALLDALYPPESCHGLDLRAYERPEVTLFVARAGGLAIGCGAYQLHGDGSAEVKSMYVGPAAQGRGVGRAILAAIEDAVRRRVTVLRLETGIHQHAAMRLYERAGFRRRGPFGSYRDDPLSVFMEKPL
jgi:putative acetyltransferase